MDAEPDIQDELAPELGLSLQNSLSLRLHPRLRRQAWRMAAEEKASKGTAKEKKRNNFQGPTGWSL